MAETEIWKGKAVADGINEKLIPRIARLKEEHIFPALGILRVGEDAGSVAYEKGATKKAESLGIKVKKYILPGDAREEAVLNTIGEINEDDDVHGVLILRPLPGQVDDKRVREALSPKKDIDGITAGSLAGVFMGEDRGYPPCTARACIEILKYHKVDISGKRVAVMGRSLVVGKPAAMMLMAENATVTICHRKTQNLEKIAAESDIIVAAMGKADVLGPEAFQKGQIVLDVGINEDEEGRLRGDVNPRVASGIVDAVTPVPGGVGSVTTTILMEHTVEAAEKSRYTEEVQDG